MEGVDLLTKSNPWFLTENEDGVTKFYSIVKEECYEDVIPDYDMCYCSLGWLLLADYDGADCYLLNPLTSEKIQLPPFNFEQGFGCTNCCLSSPPNDPECHVLFIGDGLIYFCQLGDDSLKKQELQHDQKIESLKLTSFEGKVIYMMKSGDLGVIICKGSTLEFTQLLVQNPGDIYGPNTFDLISYLIESGGDLLLVTKTYHGLNPMEISGFWIVRFDFGTNMWKKVDSIGNRTIFLRTGSGFSLLGGEEYGVKQNSIYFMESNSLYVFDLEDDSFTLILSIPSVETHLSWLYFVGNAEV